MIKVTFELSWKFTDWVLGGFGNQNLVKFPVQNKNGVNVQKRIREENTFIYLGFLFEEFNIHFRT